MPLIKSAKKAMRQNTKRRAANLKAKENLKKKLKKPPKNISELVSVIDKAAKRGIIHKNKAGRLKARLAGN